MNCFYVKMNVAFYSHSSVCNAKNLLPIFYSQIVYFLIKTSFLTPKQKIFTQHSFLTLKYIPIIMFAWYDKIVWKQNFKKEMGLALFYLTNFAPKLFYDSRHIIFLVSKIGHITSTNLKEYPSYHFSV